MADPRRLAALLLVPLLAGCTTPLKSGSGSEEQLPGANAMPPWSSEFWDNKTQDDVLAAASTIGCDMDRQVPCFDYPFKFDQATTLAAALTWPGQQRMSLTLYQGETILKDAYNAIGDQGMRIEHLLDVNVDYLLRVTTSGPYSLHVLLQEPLAHRVNDPPLPSFDFTLGPVVRIDVPPLTDTLHQSFEEGCVAVAPDGKVVLAAFHGRFAEFSPGYASLDGGETWGRIQFPADAGIGGDCAVALMEDGSWVFLGSTPLGATVLVSRDQGNSWTANPLSAIPLTGWADRPWLLGVGTELWLAYMPAYDAPGNVHFTKSLDHGASWTMPTPIGDASGYSVKLGPFARDESDVHFPMVRYFPGSNAGLLEVATTSDGGATWQVEEAQATGVQADWPAMAVTASGHQVLAFSAISSDGEGLAAIVRSDGEAWSQPIRLHDGNVEWPFIDGGHGSNVTWIVSDGVADQESLWVGRLDAATLHVWKSEVAVGPFEFASVDHDAAGHAYMVWSTWEERAFLKGTVT